MRRLNFHTGASGCFTDHDGEPLGSIIKQKNWYLVKYLLFKKDYVGHSAPVGRLNCYWPSPAQ